MTATDLLGDPFVPPHLGLSKRQRAALEHIATNQPVTSTQLGDYLARYRNKEPGNWANTEGAEMGRVLRGKGLVRYSLKWHGWVLPGYTPPLEPLGELPEGF